VPRSDPGKGTWRFRLHAGRYLLDRRPYAVAKYRSIAYRQRLAALLATGAFDAIVSDFLVPMINVPARLPCPLVVFTHNVESEIWRRHAETSGNPASRQLLGVQWERMLRFERDALSRADLILAVSDADAQTFARLYPAAVRGKAVHVVQTGVDTDYFSPRPEPPSPAHLVFTGSMDWLPNEDGMVHFVQSVLPLIRHAEPGVTLSIVGRAPTPAVRALAGEGIEVTGRVEDVRPHVARGAVYVVPLRIGGGTRLKIFEAMAMGRAVVSTAIGAEGLPVTPGRDIVIADEPEAFAREVVALLRDRERRKTLEGAARALVVENYDWSAVAGQLESALTRAARAAGANRAGAAAQVLEARG
jgi:glycosyltransferase involved in cell wall biosynthesis